MRVAHAWGRASVSESHINCRGSIQRGNSKKMSGIFTVASLLKVDRPERRVFVFENESITDGSPRDLRLPKSEEAEVHTASEARFSSPFCSPLSVPNIAIDTSHMPCGEIHPCSGRNDRGGECTSRQAADTLLRLLCEYCQSLHSGDWTGLIDSVSCNSRRYSGRPTHRSDVQYGHFLPEASGREPLQLSCELNTKSIPGYNLAQGTETFLNSNFLCESGSGSPGFTDHKEAKIDKTGTSHRTRTAFNDYQLVSLEQQFQRSRYLSRIHRIAISRNLGLTEKQVKIWYQNRRVRWRREMSRRHEIRQQESTTML